MKASRWLLEVGAGGIMFNEHRVLVLQKVILETGIGDDLSI